MKKFLLVLLILLILFGGYIIYDSKKDSGIPVLEIQEEVINIDKLYIYGTHLNLHGNVVDDNNLELVLYNGEFISEKININNQEFNLSDFSNDGIYLEDIPRGNYYLFLRSKETNDKGDEIYRYYSLNNNTEYKETTYYTFSNVNNKIIITSEESYPTMMIKVLENTDSDIYDIVIDAGHGGMDGGATRNGYKETDFTLDIATKVKSILESHGLKVKLTREEGQLTSNEKLPEYGIHGRAVIPYEVKAKYLFSIHINSNVSESTNGLEVYASHKINFDLAKTIAKNITEGTGLGYSTNKIHKLYEGIYTRTFTDEDILNSTKEHQEKGTNPYDITTDTDYYYIIRETGGIITGAYVDDRNDSIKSNPYVKSNVGVEAYLLELGYISNRSDLDKLINNLDAYAESIAKSIIPLYENNEQ